MKRRILGTARFLMLLLLGLAIAATAIAWLQGRRTPTGEPAYVALGSSFAAGADLGPLQKGSPLLCARGTGGYPQRLARMIDLPIVDMSCGGAVTRHLLDGGQFFQGPQIRVIDKRTKLVTITVGGNDLGYAGDLSLLAARNSRSLFGWLARQFWHGPAEPDYAALEDELVSLIRAIQHRAPTARIVLATYPTVLPPSGTCAHIGLTDNDAHVMREVAELFALASRAAAERTGALLVDMNALGGRNNACSAQPWTYGWTNAGKAPFHPTARGAQATAEAIASALHQQL